MNGCVYQTDDERCMKYSDPNLTARSIISWCVGKGEPCEGRVPSNGDRIRAMSDEELAEWMKTNVTCASCPVDLDACRNKLSGEMSCKEVLFDWLKSPVAPHEP